MFRSPETRRRFRIRFQQSGRCLHPCSLLRGPNDECRNTYHSHGLTQLQLLNSSRVPPAIALHRGTTQTVLSSLSTTFILPMRDRLNQKWLASLRLRGPRCSTSPTPAETDAVLRSTHNVHDTSLSVPKNFLPKKTILRRVSTEKTNRAGFSRGRSRSCYEETSCSLENSVASRSSVR